MPRQTSLGWLLAIGSLLGTRASGQEAADKVDVEIHGTILVNGFRNNARVNNSDVPTFVLPPAPGPDDRATFGAAIRQTRLIATIRGDDVLGGRLFGELDVDFFGGQQPSGGGRTHPLVRIRRGYGELRWSHLTLLIGQEAPPIVELSPSSLAASGFPLFASSGNLWLWLPQVRLTGWLTSGGPVRVGLEGAVLAPSSGDPQDPFATQPDRAEQSGRPAFEGRVLARWSDAGRAGSIGVGAHYGWFVDSEGNLVASRAVAASLAAPLGRYLELRGEVFDGRALAGLGGGGIGQLTDPDGVVPIRTTGGWGQVLLFPVERIELAVGYGIDDPRDGDLGVAAGRARNQTFALSVTGRPAPLVVGFELRRTKTTLVGPPSTSLFNTHLNLGLGIEF